MSNLLLPVLDDPALRIAVVGLGYVGLPLAVSLAGHFNVLGLDTDAARVTALRGGHDATGEVAPEVLAAASRLLFAAQADANGDAGPRCQVHIVTVPTPIDEHKRPDFGPLLAASHSIGARLHLGDVVIYESTVYPGATEEICVPALEQASGLRCNADFAVGYSPERINPGDRQRPLASIRKVTSGSTPAAAHFVDALYRRVITAGTHLAPSIKVAEAAKVIENTQRDVNIALINEFALIFRRLGIDTTQVLEAAGTKWNFLPFRPGLVGGHCIGVDPYYLIQKAQSAGYYPDILLACRRINDAMGRHVAGELVKLMVRRGHPVAGARVLVLGFAFKENCADIRNTRVIDLVRELEGFSARVDIYDPWVQPAQAQALYGITPLDALPPPGTYDALVLAVAHDAFRTMGAQGVRRLGSPRAVLYDIKGLLPLEEVDGRL